MSILSEGLQPSVLPGLFIAAGKLPALRISEVLTAKGAGFDLSFDTGNIVSTDFRDRAYISEVIAADCSRLCVAALQSVTEANRLLGDKFATPWSLIKIYYAAFYSAHSIARILGGGCCWLETAHIERVRDTATAIGLSMPFKIETGNYKCSVSPSGSILQWKKMSGGRGTHESFWAYFEELIRSCAEKILTGSMAALDAQAAFAQIGAFLDLSAAKKSNSWMSRVRNEIQYQFGHSVWHSTSLSNKDRLALSNLAAQWQGDPMQIDLRATSRYGDIGDMSTAAAFLISLCTTLLSRVAERGAGMTRSFVYFGPGIFLNQRRRHP